MSAMRGGVTNPVELVRYWRKRAEAAERENAGLREALEAIAVTTAALELDKPWVHWAEQARSALAQGAAAPLPGTEGGDDA